MLLKHTSKEKGNLNSTVVIWKQTCTTNRNYIFEIHVKQEHHKSLIWHSKLCKTSIAQLELELSTKSKHPPSHISSNLMHYTYVFQMAHCC